ncbi:MAG: RING finger domain-containing protein [Candidatus Thorarchaeota archaeon]
MKDPGEVFEFTSEADKLLKEYLTEIQNYLTVGQASRRTKKEIMEEFQEHILQAYWKETGSTSVQVEPLHELLATMGDPQEIASEYLIDRTGSGQAAVRRSSEAISSSSRQKLLERHIEVTTILLNLVLPFVAAIGIYFLLIALFSRLAGYWVLLFVISDILLVIPLTWYQFRWKRSKDLRKWRVATPRRMQIYLIAAIILLILGALLLPSLRGTSSLHTRHYTEVHEDGPPVIENSPTIEGRWKTDWHGSVYAPSYQIYYYEFYINEQFLFLATLLQLFLAFLFLLAAFKTSLQWQQADVRMVFLDVKPAIHIDGTGVIRIQTQNFNPITFPQVQLEIQDQSPGLQTAIEPSSRSAFGQHDTIIWLIWFVPKIAGTLVFGRIVLRLGDRLTVSSPKYSLLVHEQPGFPTFRGAPSKSDAIIDSYLTLDLFGICGICRQSFQNPELVSFCAACGALFHHHHLQEWLKGHDVCPNCTKPIKVPEKERVYEQLISERLEQLENECQRLRILLESSEPLKESTNISAISLTSRSEQE